MNETILIADDDADNRAIAREALEMFHYRVVEAVNGLEALEAISRENPRLVLLDLSMPKLSGWEVAKRIREMPNGADVFVLAFTAHALRGDDLRARAAGCDDYLSKPCAPAELVRKVEEGLRRKPRVRGQNQAFASSLGQQGNVSNSAGTNIGKQTEGVHGD